MICTIFAHNKYIFKFKRFKIMKKGFLSLVGAGALLAAFALNLNYAVNDYGVIDNEQHASVLAQSNSSGGGGDDSSGGGNSSGGDTSGGDTSGNGGTTIGGEGWNGDTSGWGNGTPVVKKCGTNTDVFTSGTYRKKTYTCTTDLDKGACKDGWAEYTLTNNEWKATAHSWCDKTCNQL
jgi:hypothetical protein